jgi:hypothetical protein
MTGMTLLSAAFASPPYTPGTWSCILCGKLGAGWMLLAGFVGLIGLVAIVAMVVFLVRHLPR